MSTDQLSDKDIFNVARRLDSAEAIAAYLDQVCGDDELKRERILKLVSADKADSFLEKSPLPDTVHSSIPTESKGQVIGNYKLLQKIGEGGMGVVYMAEQKQPVKRRVALKIIRPGMDSHQVIARFEAERQALALMDHPNVAKVFDAGQTEGGRPYFVMELVNGVPFNEYCDEQQLPLRERLELFSKVCGAVQHAHQKGVIHRDLKPSNILIAEYDHTAVPKVIDFGIAKATGHQLTEKTLFTEFGQIVGTLEYASPEQAKRNQLDVDTRSDVYSLGVMLYELLTGDIPYDRKRLRSAAFDEIVKILNEDPVPPSTRLSTSATLPAIATNRKSDPKKLSNLVRGELDWIAVKALEKDRDRRYQTASALGDDIDRYLADEKVLATPPSWRYVLGKNLRKHRTFAIASAAVLMALVAGAIAAGMGYRSTVLASLEADRERKSAVKAMRSAQESMSLLTDLLQKYSRDPGKDRLSIADVLKEFGTQVREGTSLQPAVAAELNLALARSFNENDHYRIAKPHFEASLTHFRNIQDKTHALKMAECDRYLGFEEKSIERIERALSVEEELGEKDAQSRSLSLLAFLQAEAGLLQESLATAKKAMTFFDGNGPSRRLEEIPHFAVLNASMKSDPSANLALLEKSAAEAAMQIAGQQAFYWWDRIQRLGTGRHYIAASCALAVSRHLDSQNSHDMRMRGIRLRNQASYAIADQVFERSVEVAPRGIHGDFASAQRARLRCDLHEFDAAVPYISQAAQLASGKDAEAFFKIEKGFMLRETGQFEVAEELFRQAYEHGCELSKSDHDKKWGDEASWLLQVVGAAFCDAEFDFEQAAVAMSKRPRNPEIDLMLGICAEQQNDLAGAFGHYESLARSRNFNNEGYYIGWVEDRLIEIGGLTERLNDVRTIFEELVTHRDSLLVRQHPARAFVRERLAEILILQGKDQERAAELLGEALEIVESVDFDCVSAKERISSKIAALRSNREE